MATRTLTELETRILDFEARYPVGAPGREAATVREFGWRLPAFEQRLQRLLQDPAALRYDPMLVKRALNARAARSRARGALRFARAV